jgi:hypothetical protein
MTKERGFGKNQLSRIDAFRMVKRRCAAAGALATRRTAIPSVRQQSRAYLLNGGNIEDAQAIAAHESPRTTKLYDRMSDEITVDEVERIGI